MKTEKLPAALLTADLHIRAGTPMCRVDDYRGEQERKLGFLANVCREHGGIPLIVAGDFGNEPYDRPPTWLYRLVVDAFFRAKGEPFPVWVALGQHDIPYHDPEKWKGRWIGLLDELGVVDVATYCTAHLRHTFIEYHFVPFGKDPDEVCNVSEEADVIKVLVWHQMVIADFTNKVWPGQKALSARTILAKYPQFDLIVTGDNHQSFTFNHKGRLLVNPGSMMRMTAAQADHQPRAYLWYPQDNTAEPVHIPIKDSSEVIDSSYLATEEEASEREERIFSFIQKLKEEDVEFAHEFEANVRAWLDKKRVRKGVRGKIWRAMGDG